MIETAVAALEAGRLVVLPTDTVYGLCSSPDEAAVRRLYAAKGRDATQPTALLFSGTDALLDELAGLDERALNALLPGPYTLVVPNPEGRYPWLAGKRPDTIGVRVPSLEGPAAEVLAAAGALAATSANLPGGPDPRRLSDVPPEIRAWCAEVVDGGELPGLPSTVLDLTGPEPVVLREGAVGAAEALSSIESG